MILIKLILAESHSEWELREARADEVMAIHLEYIEAIELEADKDFTILQVMLIIVLM